MKSFLPSEVSAIFWISLIAVIVILGMTTVIGRLFGELFPYRLRAPARFYLAPVLGLAVLTVFASLVGRVLPLGNSVLIPAFVLGLVVWALYREQSIGAALRHAMVVGLFGVVCGASILGPLFAMGAFNAHNDAFTYLVHANWLQEHAFNEVVRPDDVTPLTTQVSMYQEEGFRMGGSFLLALMQAMLNLRWSFQVYPEVMISAVAICCIATGFPIAKSMRPLRRRTRLALLALPAFTLGGLVFGANLGFLPQTTGLAFAAGLLFAVGPTLRFVAHNELAFKEIVTFAAPAGLLLAAAVFAYSELAPFLVLAVGGSSCLLLFSSRHKQNLIAYAVLLFIIAGLLLNTELARAYAALRAQSGAVVGSPVDWPLLGYAAHALGVHGGAWDGFQWTLPDSGMRFFVFGLLLTGAVAAVLCAGLRAIGRAFLRGELMPTMLILLVFVSALIYFRYFVASPFPKGVGQSWSQFKLAEWAHPFAMAFVVLCAITLCRRMGRAFEPIVVTVFALGAFSATLVGVARATPLIQYYGSTSDLNRFYQEFRETVVTHCPPVAPIYLALNGQHHKFRQMAVYYLSDRVVTSDWMDDGYIYARLPADHRTQALHSGDCVVEPAGADGWLKQGTMIGPFRVGVFDGQGQVRIIGASGAYDRETDGSNWWHWVEHKVTFKLKAFYVSNVARKTKLRFEYGTRSFQTLTLTVRTTNGVVQRYSFRGEATAPVVYETLIDLPAGELSEISIETDAEATRLADSDSRKAAFIIRNLIIQAAENSGREL